MLYYHNFHLKSNKLTKFPALSLTGRRVFPQSPGKSHFQIFMFQSAIHNLAPIPDHNARIASKLHPSYR